MVISPKGERNAFMYDLVISYVYQPYYRRYLDYRNPSNYEKKIVTSEELRGFVVALDHIFKGCANSHIHLIANGREIDIKQDRPIEVIKQWSPKYFNIDPIAFSLVSKRYAMILHINSGHPGILLQHDSLDFFKGVDRALYLFDVTKSVDTKVLCDIEMQKIYI